MHTNDKKHAIPVTTAMLSIMPHVKVKNHGFITFATRKNPKVRLWGKVVGSLPEKILKKSDVPPANTMPDGVVVIPVKKGAITRYVMTGAEERMSLVF
jgi:hypothetical protein